MDDAQLSRTLNQAGLSLEHGRKALIDIGRNLAEISLVGLLRQSQRGADLTHIGQRRGNVRAGRQVIGRRGGALGALVSMKDGTGR